MSSPNSPTQRAAQPPNPSTYPLTTSIWPNDGIVVVSDVAAVRLATFSCQFLAEGHIRQWKYVLESCKAIVNEAGILHPRTDNALRTRLAGKFSASYAPEPIDLSGQIQPMHLVYVRTDESTAPTSWQIGPRFKYKWRGPPQDGQSTTTMSHSSRSTAHQSRFREMLGRRDTLCIVTEKLDADAAHIIPQSRPEYYEEILGFDPVYYFDVSYGLFLHKAWHTSWDRGAWGLYPDPSDPSTLIVHVFSNEDLMDFHGKRIPRNRFHQSLKPPNRALLAFHYKQCVLKHIRGFEVFPVWDADASS